MSCFVVGDIQGSYLALRRLLDKAEFDPKYDQLWCVGDLVNRGGESLEVLAFLYSIRQSVRIVLGNHDIYLLALYAGNSGKPVNDELATILRHQNADLWCDWLRQQPLVHYDPTRHCLLVHAGMPHIWTLQQTLSYAGEVEQWLAGDDYRQLLGSIFGNYPQIWHDHLEGFDRLRAIVNYLTRMRFIAADGRLELTLSGGLSAGNSLYRPWFNHVRSDSADCTIVFGHWAALRGDCGDQATMPVVATDTGYVWNGRLSLFDLDDRETLFSVSAEDETGSGLGVNCCKAGAKLE